MLGASPERAHQELCLMPKDLHAKKRSLPLSRAITSSGGRCWGLRLPGMPQEAWFDSHSEAVEDLFKRPQLPGRISSEFGPLECFATSIVSRVL